MLNTKFKILSIAVLGIIFIAFWPAQLGGDTSFLIVQGNSMLPTILPGSFVIIKESPPYQIGDIIAFVQREGSAQKTIVHRIIGEDERGFVIQGDNNPKKDPGFPTEDDILGRVIFATPYVGEILGLFRNPIVLVASSIILVLIQTAQKRRRTKKERLRRIRLGLPEKPPQSDIDTKPKKPDYTLFFVALAFNVITYVAVQLLVAARVMPKGDVVTGFLYGIYTASFASTISFGLYFVFIIGLYFLAKSYEVKSYKPKIIRKKKSSLALLLGKEQNPMLAVASLFWLLFVMMSIFHLVSMVDDLTTIIT